MSVSLTKGGNVSLTKEAPGLTNVVVGLGWDVRTTTGTDFDLDASAIVVGADGRVLSDKQFVFFNKLTTPDGSVYRAQSREMAETIRAGKLFEQQGAAQAAQPAGS